MKFSNRYTGILIFSLFILNCSTVNGSGLDIAEYLQLADSGIVYPSARQIEMLKVVMPEYNYQPAPPVSNRGYWDLIADSESGKEYLKNAISKLDKEPEIPITDDIYREANLKGSRHLYKCKYYRTMERLENFILAECIENQKRFLPQICIYLRAIINMKSWLHPNHDTKDNIVLEGKSIAIDIGARKFGTDLALAEVLLRDKLPDGLRKEMANHLQRRIIDCYLKGCSEKLATHLTWFKGYSNWNSVCTSGSLFVTIAFSNDADERLASVGCALNSMNNYLSGFGEDGYCSEGINYWDYGFGHYLYLAQILYDYTGGKIDLFYADNPKKLKNIGNFPENYHIQNGIYAPFSDGSSSFPNGDGFTFLMSARYYGTILPQGMGEASMNFPDEAVYQLIAWEHPGILNMEKGAASVEPKLPGYSSFHESGVVISRGNSDESREQLGES